jgi:Baseplate J-like protein
MPIPLPRLDDRRFDDLVRDGIARAKETCPSWTDFSAGDPGVTLIEVFAFLTDALLYRVNRLPPRLQIALLNLVGVNLQPPSAATVDLVFSRLADGDASKSLTVPAGTIVATDDGSAEFVLLGAVTIASGAKKAKAKGLHCQIVEAEPLGRSTGIPGQSFTVEHPPVIAPSLDGLDFMLGVETEERGSGRTVREVEGAAYELWTETPNFTDCDPGAKVYTLDRASGRIQFSPSTSQGGNGAVPIAGKLIRAWYRHGGGRSGNVAAGVLTQIKPPIQGVEVTNPERAAGGSDGETLDALIRRAPSCLYSLRVAVTARDYEQVTLSAGGIARTSAVADAELWRHARRGVVDVRIMPAIEIGDLEFGAVTQAIVQDHRTEVLKQRAEAALEERRPLGVLTRVDWIKVQPVSVNARVMAAPGADSVEVEHGILRRLNALLSPLAGRPLGQQVRAAEIYEQILAEPGVRYADSLTLTIQDTPKADVTDLLRDPHQENCWFAVTADALHRSLDDGDSWSVEFRRDGLHPRFVRRHPSIPGLMLLAAAKDQGTALFVSYNLAETWGDTIAEFSAQVFDAAWVDRSGKPTLILATAEGLRQFVPGSDVAPSPVIVDKNIDQKGFYSVVSNVSPSGVIAVAAVARGGGAGAGGIYLSALGGLSGSFHLIGLKEKDIRHLAVQTTGSRDFLWAAAEAEAEEQGAGAFRIELRANGQDDPGGFVAFNLGWQGGSCEAITFADADVFGASNRAGVLNLNVNDSTPSWTPVKIGAGLPIRDTKRLLETVEALAAADRPGQPPIVMSGGPRGVHRSTDGGVTYQNISGETFTDRVPIPRGWLYAASQHKIDVVRDSEGRG